MITTEHVEPFRPMSRSNVDWSSLNQMATLNPKHSQRLGALPPNSFHTSVELNIKPKTPSHDIISNKTEEEIDNRIAKSAPINNQDSARNDNYYQRYLQLSANVATKHPNPGRPRERMGRIGGSWRHIREVLGYTGSQVCFVDGLVSLYDKETKKNAFHHGPAWRARMAGPTGYSANMAASADFAQNVDTSLL